MQSNAQKQELVYEISMSRVRGLVEKQCEFSPIDREQLLEMHKVNEKHLAVIESYIDEAHARAETMTPSKHMLRIRIVRLADAQTSANS